MQPTQFAPHAFATSLDAVESVRKSMDHFTDVLFKLHELQDIYTAGHQLRVGMLCEAIAKELGWAEYYCRRMFQIGLLHDIGKMAIKPEVLHKPGKLTSDEYSYVKTHVVQTFEILKTLPFDYPLAEIVGQHHERIDGSGYPHGLTGEQLYPEAKILIVADVVEAMGNRRSYRQELGIDAALAEIKKGMSTKYDPLVCEALFRLFHEKSYQLPKDGIAHLDAATD
ncbi:HDIG domain-containing protein [Acinetobacter marinus]|uniref:HDIG domain-containing protein n=1 Tax=Acinetobacter marinus TaxID=281375 RepID=A0A1G6GN26_9GAMM|nr:HD-GYP domain-containing protein [Acinetobacter marinus]SDB83387.1 HDIG domain-containing protein [Acinetobacter marinus]